MGMTVGYARTGAFDRAADLAAQVTALEEAGCRPVFKEQVSSVSPRPQLEAALGRLGEGDALAVTGLERLARSTRHLGEVVDAIRARGAQLRILDLDSGDLILNLLAAVARFERQMMLERQREGIAKAKAEGKYKGRKPTVGLMAAEICAMKQEGMGATSIARELGVGRTSIYRILNER